MKSSARRGGWWIKIKADIWFGRGWRARSTWENVSSIPSHATLTRFFSICICRSTNVTLCTSSASLRSSFPFPLLVINFQFLRFLFLPLSTSSNCFLLSYLLNALNSSSCASWIIIFYFHHLYALISHPVCYGSASTVKCFAISFILLGEN